DPASTAARAIAGCSEFEAFARCARDTIEVIGGSDILYVFTGSPPHLFGFVWFDLDGMHDTRSAVEHGELTYDAAMQILSSLGTIYRSYDHVERFHHAVQGRWVTVVDSQVMHSSITKAIHRVRSAVTARHPDAYRLQDRMQFPQS
ncbi:MAG: hypothetical protein ACYC6C_12165, partial [Coriobacteriia bacterium]